MPLLTTEECLNQMGTQLARGQDDWNSNQAAKDRAIAAAGIYALAGLAVAVERLRMDLATRAATDS
ncbi:MAG: hypothetical protein J2P30_24420 [Actinobacteria bacterium]|nr:hypothetical protein [Actinomycetota bacterium]